MVTHETASILLRAADRVPKGWIPRPCRLGYPALCAVHRLLDRLDFEPGFMDYVEEHTAAEVAHLLRAAALEGLWA